MSLLSLPNELLSTIISLVSPTNFREDVDRLLVCKRWYTLAREVLHSDVVLYADDLPSLFSSITASGNLSHVYEPLQHTAKRLRVRFQTHEAKLARRTAALNLSDPKYNPSDDLETEYGSPALTNPGLQQFALTVLPHLTRLHTLEIVALDGLRRGNPRGDYLWDDSLASVLENLPSPLTFGARMDDGFQPQRLTTLVIDTRGTILVPRSSEDIGGKPPLHMCTVISSHLPALKDVRLRMQRVCPEILNLASGTNCRSRSHSAVDTEGHDLKTTKGKPCQLESLQIDLGLNEEEDDTSTGTPLETFSRHCTNDGVYGFKLMQVLVGAARKLVAASKGELGSEVAPPIDQEGAGSAAAADGLVEGGQADLIDPDPTGGYEITQLRRLEVRCHNWSMKRAVECVSGRNTGSSRLIKSFLESPDLHARCQLISGRSS